MMNREARREAKERERLYNKPRALELEFKTINFAFRFNRRDRPVRERPGRDEESKVCVLSVMESGSVSV
jgi:hypothetical protein